MTLISAYIDLFIRGESPGREVRGKMSGYRRRNRMSHDVATNGPYREPIPDKKWKDLQMKGYTVA